MTYYLIYFELFQLWHIDINENGEVYVIDFLMLKKNIFNIISQIDFNIFLKYSVLHTSKSK